MFFSLIVRGDCAVMTLSRTLAALAAVLLLVGCSSTTTIKVPVPPRVDLSQFHTIGLVTFASNDADQSLRQHCTQQFLQAVQAAQPGTRVIELGVEPRVLSAVNSKRWDAASFNAVKAMHNVDAIIIGRFELEKSKPDISLSTVWRTLSVKSDVKGALTAKLVETGTGATLWTDSAEMTTTVAGAHFNSQGQGVFKSGDEDSALAQMIQCLVRDTTDGFRTHYVTKRVPKESLRTASANQQ